MALTESSISYEDIRRQRLEENKKRMEELGLTDLSKTLSRSMSPVVKSSAPRQAKARSLDATLIEPRRSSRVANNPAPNYREADFNILIGRRSYGRISRLPRKYASDKDRIQATTKAEELQGQLDQNNPSCVKPMLQSHVSGGFWLSLPFSFCRAHLPRKDDTIVLEDENGGEWETVYLVSKNGLSGGWRGFSIDHGLNDGDAIVFELVELKRLKVHIVRAEEKESVVMESNKKMKGETETGSKWKKEAKAGLQKGGKKRSQHEDLKGKENSGSVKKMKHVRFNDEKEEEQAMLMTGVFQSKKAIMGACGKGKAMVPTLVKGIVEVY